MEFTGHALLLDVEGTTSSISYVFDVLFPYAKQHVESYLDQHWGESELDQALDYMAHDVGLENRGAWLVNASPEEARQKVVDEVHRQIDHDVKATGLKKLQGLIWKVGFESGDLQSHVYDDVPVALKSWHDAGWKIAIYSSGSVQAQHLFFKHTAAGNLRGYLDDHFDTTTGAKKEVGSYVKIASALELPRSSILFLSDVLAELDAAAKAGLATALLERPGNKPVASTHAHPVLTSFDQLQLTLSP